MNWIKEIKNAPKIKQWSQAGEEGYIKFILAHIGFGNRTVVDIGASDGSSNSNSKYLIENGFTGYLFDGDNKGNPEVKEEWITAENVVDILDKHNVPFGFTVLSLDLDGNDYDILKQVLLSRKPMLVVCEINGTIPGDICKKMKYNPNHRYQGDDYYGFSFDAALKLTEETGYRVVFQNDALNAYLVRKDLLEEPDAEIMVEFEFHPYHAHNPDGEWDYLT